MKSDEIRLCCPPLSGRECRKCKTLLTRLGRKVTITRNMHDLPLTASSRQGHAVYLLEGHYGNWRLIPWTADALTAAAALPQQEQADRARLLGKVDAFLASRVKPGKPLTATGKPGQQKPVARPTYKIWRI
ncbi:hypothetical protein OG470_15700 [Micromonospora sp. NBC_00389]|uniref:hypothetical protein n=1 Tax=Micromonospora sp. NBC_00389 TaxID=2903586 RepID=UPI002E202E3E